MVQYGSKITQNMKMAKIVQNNLGKIIWYSNTFVYFGRIYSFAKIFVDFSRANLFGYSFVIFLLCRIYSDIHSSNIYSNEYIRIFIRPKIWYSSHTGLFIYLFVPFPCDFFLSLSLALRSHDQIPASHWPSGHMIRFRSLISWPPPPFFSFIFFFFF